MVLFENVFPGDTIGQGRVEIGDLGRRAGVTPRFSRVARAAGGSAYPLMLISPASDKRISSTLGSIGASSKAPPLMMHPADAAQRGLTAARSRCGTNAARSILPLQVTDKVPPGVVASEKGAWLSTSRTGQTISALVSADTRADLALGACFNDTRVEVARV